MLSNACASAKMEGMNRFRRLLFMLIIVAALTPVSCGDKPEKLVAQQDAEKPGEQTAAPSVEIEQELQNVRFSHSKGDKLQWVLEARTVEQAADGPIHLKSVEITYYSDDGKITVVTADAGLYDGAGRNATLRGNVVVETSDGGHVETSAIHWNQDSQALTGEGDVTMSRGGSTIKGRGFELRPELETFRIYHVDDGIIDKGDMNL